MTEKLAFVFPGQGSQTLGMGQELAKTYPEAANIFKQADEILDAPLSEICWQGPEDELNDTYNTQPGIFVSCLATLAALRAAGYVAEPDFVAGHSLGEYVAYVAAGVLSFEDGLKLVRERARLMREAGQQNPGKMAAIIKLNDEQVGDICRQVSAETGWIQIANYNAPGQVIISGDKAGIDRAIELAKAAGARKAIGLPVSIAAHSKLMETANANFEAAVNAAKINAPDIPVVANITARPLNSVEAIQIEMVGQLTSSVQWSKSVQFMIAQGVSKFVEIGPKNVLTSLLKRIDRSVSRVNVENTAGIGKLLQEQPVKRTSHAPDEKGS
ncbi:MAG TPA: ACP S-malonyltransferase [Chloroflexi bacterium]|nr:MAG: [acyl-carrier-protein] S-malonyltransferase [Anaerolineaceae bacterium 4572_5.2]HEY85673.1 ACP S-malonyltransferase [Chloroflexota bacterium]